MASDSNPRYRFGDFELDIAAYDLRRRGSRVRLERRPMDLLILLVTRRGELVTRTDIVERLWGAGVFVDVEMGINTAIRKVRQALHDSPEQPVFVETVVGRGYRFIAAVEALGSGIPPKTPTEPSADSAPVEHPPEPAPPTGAVAVLSAEAPRPPAPAPVADGVRRSGRVWLLGAIAGALAVVALAALRTRSPSAPRPQERTAVILSLPPINAPQGDGELQLLGLSLTDLLAQQLATLPDLKLAYTRYPADRTPSPSGTVGAAKSPPPAAPSVALVGALRRSADGTRSRLRVELAETDAIQGATRRTEIGEFEVPLLRETGDASTFLRVRDAIVAQVLALVRPAISLSPDPSQTPRSMEAYRLYLQAVNKLREAVCTGGGSAALLERSIAIDPQFSPAWEELGWARYELVSSCGETADNYRLAREAAEKALTLAPGRARAACLEAVVLVESDQAEEAYAVLLKAAAKQPGNLDLRFAQAYVLTYAGFLDTATRMLESAVAEDPTRATTLAWSTNAFLYRGDLARFNALLPASDSPLFRFYRGYAEHLAGHEDEAVRLLDPVFAAFPNDQFARLAEALLNAVRNRPADAEGVLDQLIFQRAREGASDGEFTFKIAFLLARSGRAEKALQQLQLAVRQGFFCPACIESEPDLRRLAADPAFRDLLTHARERHRLFSERFDVR